MGKFSAHLGKILGIVVGGVEGFCATPRTDADERREQDKLGKTALRRKTSRKRTH